MKTKKKIEMVDGYKNRKFQLCMNINNAPFEYPGVVIESYGTLCLVQEQKASYEGRFNTYGIYNVRQNSKGEESLSDLMIDYSKEGLPVYSAPEPEVRAKFADIVVQKKLKESEDQLRTERLALEQEEKRKTEELRIANSGFINSKLSQVNDELKGLIKGQSVSELFADKKVRSLVIDIVVLEKLKQNGR